jgi:hypothetical protein
VCFANWPLGPAHTITRLVLNAPMLELDDIAGQFGKHLFVEAPAEPISLPPVTVEVLPSAADLDAVVAERELIAGKAAEPNSAAQLLPVLTTIAVELTKIRVALTVRNGLAAGDGYPD